MSSPEQTPEEALRIIRLDSCDNARDFFSAERQTEQTEFFKTTFAQAKFTKFTGRRILGPAYQDFKETLEAFDQELKEVHPSLTAEHVEDICYISDAAQAHLDALGTRIKCRVRDFRDFKANRLGGVASQQLETWPQLLPENLFDRPPYYQQGDNKDKEERWKSARLCLNACFRMMYGGITDEVVFEEPVNDGLVESQKFSERPQLADDEMYLRIFQTPAFLERHDQEVAVVSFTGMDINTVAKLAAGVRKRRPNSKIFCMISLRNENIKSIWHTNMLVGVTREGVLVHDPGVAYGAPDRTISKEVFLTRWGVALNRGHLIIAE